DLADARDRVRRLRELELRCIDRLHALPDPLLDAANLLVDAGDLRPQAADLRLQVRGVALDAVHARFRDESLAQLLALDGEVVVGARELGLRPVEISLIVVDRALQAENRGLVL